MLDSCKLKSSPTICDATISSASYLLLHQICSCQHVAMVSSKAKYKRWCRLGIYLYKKRASNFFKYNYLKIVILSVFIESQQSVTLPLVVLQCRGCHPAPQNSDAVERRITGSRVSSLSPFAGTSPSWQIPSQNALLGPLPSELRQLTPVRDAFCAVGVKISVTRWVPRRNTGVFRLHF